MSIMTRVFLLWLACIALASALVAQQPVAPIIREIVFQGDAALPAAAQQQLREVIQPLIGQRYDENIPGVLQQSILETGWVQAATVTSTPVENGVRLTVQLTPNPPIKGIEFTGNKLLSSDVLRAVVPLKPGDIFNAEQARAAAQSIQQAYAARGYPLVEVTDVSLSPDGVLLYTIREPVISEIRIEGAHRTRPEVVRQLLGVKTGDVFNENKLRTALANIQRLGIFENISVTPEAGTEPGTLALVVTVQEARTGNLQLGGTYNEAGGLSGYLIFSESNLFGRAQRVSLDLEGGANRVYQIDYFNPLIGGPQTTLGTSAYIRDEKRVLVNQLNQEINYLAKRRGVNVSLGKQLTPFTQVVGTVRLSSINAVPSTDVNVPPIILGTSDVRSLALSGIRDTRSSPLYPIKGAFAQITTEGAGLFGGSSFLKLSGDARKYWAIGGPKGDRPPRVFATRLLAGVSTGTPPFLDQYFVGGLDTLRGYKIDRFVGNNQLLFSNELRYPLTSSIQAVAFVDIGDAWGGAFAEALGDRGFKVHAGFGPGLRITSPLGPIRFDYGFNGQGGHEFHFGIGPTF